MNESFHTYQSFLYSRRSDEQPSHVSLVFPKGKFLIEEKEMSEFWDIYSQYDGSKGMAEMTLTMNVLPIIVDFDLKREIDSAERTTFTEKRVLYTLKHVQTIVNIYQRVLRDILLNIDERHLVCFLLEKQPYYHKNRDRIVLKNGFHLHFPFLFMEKIRHENDLLPRIRFELKKLDRNQDELPAMYTDQSVDKCYVRSPWLLYGSHKEGGEPYRISCALDAHGRMIDDWANVLDEYHIYDCFEQRIRVDVSNIQKFLPQILSLHLCFRNEYVYETKKNLPLLTKRSTPSNQNQLMLSDGLEMMGDKKDIGKLCEIVNRLMTCISDRRAEQRNEWMHMGWILYNIFRGTETGYQIWLEFSKRSDKFQESICFYEWNRMQFKDLSLGSLKYIAKEDNESVYDDVMRELNKDILDRCFKLSGTHHDLALALFQKYESYFVCASLTHRLWFEFRNHIWIKIDEGYSLRRKISGELVDEYEKMAKQIVTRLRMCESEEESDKENNKLKLTMKLIKNLKSAPFKSHILKECMEVFHQEGFLSKLDSDPYLIAFSNGVYDIRQHIFREGRPQDYISLKMNIQYLDHYTDDCKEIKDIEHYFMQIFPDVELREYFLDSAAEIFIGGNFNKVVQIWSGEGDNGKSITQTIFEQMLGPYNVKLPTSLITGKRTQSSAACPELARAGNGVRFAMLQEPDQKDIVNIGILKELSGNDTFFARGLYKEGQEINPMFKLVLICNEPPKLTYSDKAAWNRIKMIPFESTFTDEAPDTFEEQMKVKKFPKDLKFRDKIPRMVEPLAFYLLKRLKERPESKKIPLKVALATENYKRKNDIFKQYLDEWIQFEDGKFCNATELYVSFREWQRESCPNQSCPDRNEFLEYVIRLWGPHTKDGWFGRYIRGPTDHS